MQNADPPLRTDQWPGVTHGCSGGVIRTVRHKGPARSGALVFCPDCGRTWQYVKGIARGPQPPQGGRDYF